MWKVLWKKYRKHGKYFEVRAVVKPGANTEPTVNITNSDVTRLTTENVCIIWGGTWDVAKSETEMGLCLLKKSGARHQHTNLVMMSVPHRYILRWNHVWIMK